MKLLWLSLAFFALAHAQEGPVPSLINEPATTTTEPPKDATYWLTVSRKIRPGHPLKLNVQILKGSDPVSVKMTIMDQKRTPVFTSQPALVNAGGQVEVITINIPMDIQKPSDSQWGGGQYYVNIEGTGRTVNFNKTEYFTYEQKSFSIFVQTDKAIYKQRQTVKFRVLAMMPDMKVIKDEPMDIIIKDPQENRIRQWLAVADPNGRGVVELTFQLADGIPTGDWNIEVTIMGLSETKSFTVDDYVLPKFEVEIIKPSFGLSYDPMVPITVKAKYTFGQPVTTGVAQVIIKDLYKPYGIKVAPEIRRGGQLNKDGEFSIQVSSKEILDMLKQGRKYVQNLNWNSIQIIANVTESNTGRIQGSAENLQFYDTPMKMQFLDISPNNFKPGLSYTGYIEVKKQDDSLFSATEASSINVVLNVTYQVPRPKEDMTTTTTPEPTMNSGQDELIARPIGPGGYIPRTMTKILILAQPIRTLPETGWITVTFDVPAEAESMIINAKAQKPFSASTSQYLSKSHSPSDSFLQVKVPTEKPRVGQTMNVRAEATDLMTKLNYQIYSKGMLVASGSETSGGSRVINFSFVVTQEMAPNMNIVVFYVRDENDEFVVDAISISVEGLFQKPVSIEFSATKVKPGEKVDVIVKAEKDSLVHVLAVDKSVKLLKTGNDITQDQVREELVQYDYGGVYPMWRYMFICGWPSYFGGSDAAEVFRSANVVVLTDGNVYQHTYERDEFLPEIENTETAATGGTANKNPSPDFQAPETVRKFFPENWLWEISYITPDSSGQVVLSVTAPDTITSWIASVFSVHPEFGLSVAEEPAVLTTFRDMFVSLDLPLSIIRGEDYCFTASVFSYYPGQLPVLLTLDKSDNFSNIHVKYDGRSVTVSKESTYYSYFLGFLEENDVVASKFCLTPNDLGDIPVKVSALTNVGSLSDAVIRMLRVKPEGVPRASTSPYLIDLSAGAFEQTIPVNYPSSAVQGSERLKVSVAGNLLGPMFENLDDLLKQPYGCGEQNMLNFAPNIFLLQFFFTTNTITDEIRQRAVDYMLIGYQKEIKYEHRESGGGFSAFGDRDGDGKEKASLWLTAFVTQCFAQAEQLDLKYGNIVAMDTDIIARSVRWMIRQQNKNNGSFVEYGKVFHKEMQGGSAEGEALTAYTIIALYEAGQVFVNDTVLMAEIQSSIDSAANFLATSISTLTDPYDICIVAYTLHLIDHPRKQEIFDKMESIAQVGGGVKYWERTDSQHKTISKYSWSASADSISIEMTSYALLTYSFRGIEATAGLPVIRWMSNQRGPKGGFISTQDTVRGLQALSAAASKLYTNEDIPMTVTVTYTTADGTQESKSIKINKANEMLLQTIPIDYSNNAPSSVKINAVTDNGQQGPSTVIAEVILNYNVNEETAVQIYDMSHTLTETSKGFELNIRVRTIHNEPSDMAILEVDIPAGHSPDTESLTAQKHISRVEIIEDKLTLYFNTDVIDGEGVSVQIQMVHSGGVLAKAKPKFYRIYDYYEPDFELTKAYTLASADFCTKAPDVGVCQYVRQ